MVKSLLLFITATTIAAAAAIHHHQEIGFEHRRQVFIKDMVSSNGSDIEHLIFAAKLGRSLNTTALDEILEELPKIEVADFRIVKLVRLMQYTSEFDDKILPVLRQIPFWLTSGEKLRCYWSENHMIMWTGSAWLMKEKDSSWPVDTYLRQRLVTYLDLKIQYGFYEFFSNNYFRFTLSGLLNLADFAQDHEIQTKAVQAAMVLLNQVFLSVTDKGSFVAANGRNSNSRAYDEGICLLLGAGPTSNGTSISHSSLFLATTDVDMTPVLSSWKPSVDTTIQMGHSYQDTAQVFQTLPKQERIVFQWSFGGYLAPEVAGDTAWLVSHYKLQQHDHWKLIGRIPGFLTWLLSPGSKLAASLSRSSVLTGAKVSFYRSGPSALSSIQNYFGGYLGWQQLPWVASTGRQRIYAETGPANGAGVHKQNQNSHLPRVFQKKNVALIMYRQNGALKFLTKLRLIDLAKTVSLRWPETGFDQVVHSGFWTLGREGDAYIAVRRHCDGLSCDEDGQTWAVVVGNAEIHGSFEKFQKVIRQSSYEHKWKRKRRWSPIYNYFGQIQVDGIKISHTWE